MLKCSFKDVWWLNSGSLETGTVLCQLADKLRNIDLWSLASMACANPRLEQACQWIHIIALKCKFEFVTLFVCESLFLWSHLNVNVWWHSNANMLWPYSGDTVCLRAHFIYSYWQNFLTVLVNLLLTFFIVDLSNWVTYFVSIQKVSKAYLFWITSPKHF